MDKTTYYLSQVWDSVATDFGSVEPSIWSISGEKLVSYSKIKYGSKVLDIGTGKGATLIPISKTIGPQGTVIGVDLSISMVNYTNRLINELNLENCQILHINAADLNFPQDYFHHMVAGFSLRYFLQNAEIFHRLIKPLKPAGTLSFTLWAPDAHDVDMDCIISRYIDLIPSAVNELDTDKEPLTTAHDIENRLKFLGMHDICVQVMDEPIIYSCFDDVFKEFWNSQYRVNMEKIMSLGKNIYEDFYNSLSFYFERFRVREGIKLTWKVLYAVCKK